MYGILYLCLTRSRRNIDPIKGLRASLNTVNYNKQPVNRLKHYPPQVQVVITGNAGCSYGKFLKSELSALVMQGPEEHIAAGQRTCVSEMNPRVAEKLSDRWKATFDLLFNGRRAHAVGTAESFNMTRDTSAVLL